MSRKFLICLILSLLISVSFLGYFFIELQTNSLSFGKDEITEENSLNQKNNISAPIAQENLNTKFVKLEEPNPQFENVENIPVLMYHHVSTVPPEVVGDAIAFGLRVSPEVFELQIKKLIDENYTTLTIDEYHNILNGLTKSPEKPLLLTFDDGFKDNYDFAYKILEKYDQKGNFAIVTGVIGTGEYMSWENIIEIQKSGHGIISHTNLHCSLSVRSIVDGVKQYADNIVNEDYNPCPSFTFGGALTTGQVRHEIRDSKEKLEEKLGIEVTSFIYPFGNYNEQTLEILSQEGYVSAFTVDPGVGNVTPVFEIPRVRIHGQQEGGLTGFFAEI